ncbi:MAG TPA: SGNH/GDSL hydrolase family protein [Pirellulaceae bacterium]|nr:SGNH/GDSL hydrolase family protein [Pirellulaceae bacterium]
MKPTRLFAWSLAFLSVALLLALPVAADETPDWVRPMQEVHARFCGTPGTFAMFGDSISVSQAFWSPLRGEPQGLSDDAAAAHQRVTTYLRPECWSEWRGAEHGNEGGMTIRWAHENVQTWLKKLNPETAVVMFGSNDLGQLEAKEFEQKTAEVVDRCLENGTVVLLTTLPPRSGLAEQSKQFAEAVRRVARQKRVPLIDYQAEILKRRPDDWDGSLPQFKEVEGSEYEVPTLICRDGVHPSFPKAHQDFSDESLSKNGYQLRTYLTLLAYDDVLKLVCGVAGGQAAVDVASATVTLKQRDSIIFFGDSLTQLAGQEKPAEHVTKGYVRIVREKLRETHKDLNVMVDWVATSGHTVPDLLKRVDNDVIVKKPTIVFIQIGCNDARRLPRETFEKGLEELIDKLQDAGIQVIQCSLTSVGEKHDGTNQDGPKLEEFAQVAREIAAKKQLPLNDLRKAFVAYWKEHNTENKPHGLLTYDGNHFNQQGHDFVAEQMLKKLK